MNELSFLSFGYGSAEKKRRESPHESWRIWLKSGASKPLSLREECLLAAKEILDHCDRPAILFSGGIDSEVVLRSFLALGARPDVFFLRFKGGLNDHDHKWAREFMDSVGAKLQIIELDVEDFFESGRAFEMAHRYQASHLEFCTTLYLMQELPDRFVVLGSGEPYFMRLKRSPVSAYSWYHCERENAFCWSKFLMDSPGSGARFFHARQEIHLAYARELRAMGLFDGAFPGKISSATLKPQIFAKAFDCPLRPKYTGFEHLGVLAGKFQSGFKSDIGSFSAIYPHDINKMDIS